MIPYIDTRLQEWAEWSRMRLDGFYGIGASQFFYDEPMPGGTGYVRLPSNDRCLQTEEGVAWLGMENRLARDCVVVRYRAHPGWSQPMQAQLVRVSERTFRRRIELAHALLLAYFIDRAFGLVPQTEELRLRKIA